MPKKRKYPKACDHCHKWGAAYTVDDAQYCCDCVRLHGLQSVAKPIGREKA